MIVMLDVFSGRPNPTWTLSEEEEKQLLERVKGRGLAAADAPDAGLGYRGLVVRATQDDVEDLPQEFRIAGVTQAGDATRATGERALNVDEENEVAQFLLQAARGAVNDDLQQFIAGALQRRIAPLPPIARPPGPLPEPIPHPPQTCEILNTGYNPGFWNNSYYVMGNNNCYNYAMNNQTNTYAQPGKISGQVYTSHDCSNVGEAASRDGCKPSCNGRVKLVALAIWPGQDYHWYRRNSEGFWGHKPGGTPARNTDHLDYLIDGSRLTPANCSRGPYSVFCGYRYSPKGMKVL